MMEMVLEDFEFTFRKGSLSYSFCSLGDIGRDLDVIKTSFLEFYCENCGLLLNIEFDPRFEYLSR